MLYMMLKSMAKRTATYAVNTGSYKPPRDTSPERIKKALTAANGNIRKASEMLDVPFDSLYAFLKNDPEFWLLRQRIIDENLDTAEDKLMEQVKGGNLQAIMFFLKCQGKRRGWVERPIIAPASMFQPSPTVLLQDENRDAQQQTIDLSNYNLEELQQLKNLLNSTTPKITENQESLLIENDFDDSEELLEENENLESESKEQRELTNA